MPSLEKQMSWKFIVCIYRGISVYLRKKGIIFFNAYLDINTDGHVFKFHKARIFCETSMVKNLKIKRLN